MKKFIFLNIVFPILLFSQYPDFRTDELFLMKGEDSGTYTKEFTQEEWGVDLFSNPVDGKMYFQSAGIYFEKEWYYKIGVVVDKAWNRIVLGRLMYTEDGDFVGYSDEKWAFCNYGSGDKQLNSPEAVAITYSSTNSVNVYIADTGNNRIVKFRISLDYGTILSHDYFYATSHGGFNWPVDVEVYSTNNLNPNDDELWIVDKYNHRIVRMDATNGNVLETIGSFGSGDHQLNAPTAISLNHTDGTWLSSYSVLIADNGNNRLVVHSYNGIFGIFNFSAPTNITSVHFYGDQNWYAVDRLNHKIYRGMLLLWSVYQDAEFGEYGAGDNRFRFPVYLCIPDLLSVGDNGGFVGQNNIVVGESWTNFSGVKYYNGYGVDITFLELESQPDYYLAYSYWRLTDCYESVKIKDQSGAVVKTKRDFLLALRGGPYIYSWDGKDDQGILVSPGKYVLEIYQESTTDPSINKKVTQEFTLFDNFDEDTWLSGNIIISQNITLSNSSTLTIDPGTTIKMDDNVSIIVESGSKIIANGTLINPIYFVKRSNNAWDRISLQGDNNQFTYCTFDGGTYNVDIRSENNTFTNCTFKNATRGLYFYNVSSGTVSNSKFQDNSYGLYLYNSSPLINNNTVISSSSNAIYMYGGAPQLLNNSITNNNNDALYVKNSQPDLGIQNAYGDIINGYNVIADNSGVGIYSVDSDIDMGTQGSCAGCHGGVNGNNSVYNNINNCYTCHGGSASEVHVVSMENSSVTAEGNWWGAYPPEAGTFFTWGFGTINYNNSLSSDPNQSSSAMMAEPLATHQIGQSTTIHQSATTEKQQAAFNHSKLKGFDLALYYQLSGNYDKAIIQYKSYIQKNRRSDKSPSAMRNLSLCYQKAEKTGLKGYLHSMTEQSAKDAVAETGLQLKANLLVKEGNHNEAVNLNNLSVQAFAEDAKFKRSLLFDNIMISFHDLKDKQQATGYYNQLLSQNSSETICPEDRMARHAANLFNDGSGQFSLSKNSAELNDISNMPKKYALSQNYPNPFNPVTTIPFGLPQDSHVKIVVYNILGQKVTTLVNGQFNAGVHKTQFNGNNLASGLYFVHAQMKSMENSGKHSFLQKILLIK